MTQLLRTLGLRDMVLLIIGSVIGSGIFLVPGGILRQVDQSVGMAALVWVVGGVLSLLSALSYGELAAMKPEAGGLYVTSAMASARCPPSFTGGRCFWPSPAGRWLRCRWRSAPISAPSFLSGL
jgi:basic amino acid/polyamine antiporter, APA family